MIRNFVISVIVGSVGHDADAAADELKHGTNVRGLPDIQDEYAGSVPALASVDEPGHH
jgi:hypothetical protein